MPCSDNGYIPAAELVEINGGRLREDAARGWKAPGGPEDAGLYPTGPELSSYRDHAGEVKTWEIYQHGGPLAAPIGTSEHGCGRAVDLAAMWMRQWIDAHGAAYGWKKTEAFSEWWHVNFIGGVKLPPIFKTLQRGDRGKRVKRYSRRLAYIKRSKADRKARHATMGGYGRKLGTRKFGGRLKWAVSLFQRDHGLRDDGVIGPKTAALIDAVFRKQWAERSK
jgi:hypothetical protein